MDFVFSWSKRVCKGLLKMTELNLTSTSRTPSVILKKSAKCLIIEGKSYPEDVNSFYAQIFAAIDDYFATGNQRLDVDIKLIYFNSSSAHALTELLDKMEDHATKEAAITIKWFCDSDDDITREFAEDVACDMKHLTVTILDMKRDG